MGELESYSGDFPIYGASGLIKRIDRYEADAEYVAIIKDGSGVGRVTHYPAKTSIINTMQYLFPKENCTVRYLEYLLRYMNLGESRVGSAIPHIYFKDYSKNQVPVPDIELQNKFENIAQQADKSKFELNNSIAAIDKVIKSLINENL